MAQDGAGGQRQSPVGFPPERPGTPCIGSLMGAGANLDGCRISHFPPRLDHRTVQPVAIRLTDWSIPSQRRLNVIVKNNRIFISPTQILFPIKYEYMGYRFRINWLVHHRAFYTRKTAGKFNNMVTKLYWFGVVCGFPHYNEWTYVAILTVSVHSIAVGYRVFYFFVMSENGKLFLWEPQRNLLY